MKMSRNNLYLLLAFLTGTVMLVYETYSIKVLFFFFVETTQAVAIALSAFLAGLAFSSIFFAKYATDENKSLRLISMLHLFSGVYGYFILKQYQVIPDFLDFLKIHGMSESIVFIFKFTVTWLFLFIPAFLGGGIFPIVNGLYQGAENNKTKDVAKVYFFDTLGAIIGTLFAGFVLLTYGGLDFTLLAASVINFTAASFFANRKFRMIILLCFLLVVGEYFLSQKYKRNAVGLDAYYLNDPKLGEIVFQKESPFGVITVGNVVHENILNKVLFINLREMCSGSFHYAEDVIAEYIVKSSKDKLLNIGLGCGFTANRLSQLTSGHIDIVEINPVVASAAKNIFFQENERVLEKSHVSLIIDDGAQYIRRTDKKYDGIVVDVEEVRVIHSSPLFTLEYFKIIQSKINSGGVFSLWSPNGGAPYIRVLHNTLNKVFSNVDFRILGKGVLFFSSNAQLVLPEASEEDIVTKKQMLELQIADVNSMNERSLEKYFDIYSIFGLPKEYKEKTIKEL